MSLAIGLAISGLALELETSWLQSRWLAAEARRLTFRVEPGATTAVPLSPTGPHDRRLGYATLPASLIRLQRAGYEITAQAGSSDRLLQLAGLGLYPIYREKPHTGLRLLDRDGLDLLGPTYSERAYRSVDQIPTLVLNTLLFIEDRDLLEPRRPHRNPAVEWDRFALAVASLGLHRIFPAHPVVGGSTLATQLEKLRHSPGGLTSSVQDKLVQMVSASLRGYLDGDETLDARRRLLRDYINSMPLAASPDYGEVVGLGDGLWAWWGADVDRVNGLLAIDEAALTASRLAERALAYRQVLSLLLAINRPSTYLIRDREALASRTDRFLPLLAEANIISPDLRDDGAEPPTGAAPPGSRAEGGPLRGAQGAGCHPRETR